MGRRGSRPEIAAWVACAVITGSAAIGLFPYMYLGLVSFLLLPLVAICWSRAILLSAPAGEGGQRGRVVVGLVAGTCAGGIITSRVVRGLIGPGGVHD
jgi:hypothetical protein